MVHVHCASLGDVPSRPSPIPPSRSSNSATFLPGRLCSRRLLQSKARRPRAGSQTETELLTEIEGVERDYCDDFVCTSSPAVEQTVKAFAIDLQRCGGWTTSRFAQGVEYQDSYRSFVGREKYARPTGWIENNVKEAKVVVKRMRMLDKGTAILNWTLTGKLQRFQLEADCQTAISLNLLTGQVTKHLDEWDLSKCALPASLAFSFSRAKWAAQEVAKDTRDEVDKISQSFGSMDEEDRIYGDPTDPTKFFQQDDNSMQDAIQVAALLALIYTMYKAYSFIFTLNA
ncbi:hypothetical protein BSKO_04444 [Bryopsis sp. KO-2023]|nr:hypothetical protein BSKO_04444 [Bryopsis sp. KO-2023]